MSGPGKNECSLAGWSSWEQRLSKLSSYFRMLWPKEMAGKMRSVGMCERHFRGNTTGIASVKGKAGDEGSVIERMILLKQK